MAGDDKDWMAWVRTDLFFLQRHDKGMMVQAFYSSKVLPPEKYTIESRLWQLEVFFVILNPGQT